MKRLTCIYIVLTALLLALFVLNVCGGSEWYSPWQVWQSIMGADDVISRLIVSLRLPKAVTAVLVGLSLSVSGVLLQTLFRNPLAGPYILGINSGASLGVALLTMLIVSPVLMSSILSIGVPLAALIGAFVVTLLMLSVSRRVKSSVSLLIVGMMVGAVAGALVNLIQNFANPDSLKMFIVWTFGSLSGTDWQEIMIILSVIVVAMFVVLFLVKPLNGLLLGESYARALGINIERVRAYIVVATSLLTGIVTAYCGPIAFIGVAVPHIARGILCTTDHRQVIPVSILLGADLLLACDIVCNIFTYPLPISTVSALVGAPIIIAIIFRSR